MIAGQELSSKDSEQKESSSQTRPAPLSCMSVSAATYRTFTVFLPGFPRCGTEWSRGGQVVYGRKGLGSMTHDLKVLGLESPRSRCII